jgi:phosphoribosylformylglycinamidine synthase
MKATIKIRLKKGILDPQGKTVNNALNHLGFDSFKNLRIGKLIELDMNEKDEKKATDQIEQACKKLLANPVIEEFTYELIKDKH